MDEPTRATFMANATVALGSVMGLFLTVPLAGSLIPESLLKESSRTGTWAPLPSGSLEHAAAKPGVPLKVSFAFSVVDGYLPSADRDYDLWAVKMTPQQSANFRTKRPELFSVSPQAVSYDPVSLDYVLFSPICPHLGCSYKWDETVAHFICPCHGSEFDGTYGTKIAGPTPRGLDPLPLREKNGHAEVTWIQYKSGTPDRLIVAYN